MYVTLLLLIIIALSSPKEVRLSRKCGWDTSNITERLLGTRLKRPPPVGGDVVVWTRGDGPIDDPRIRDV
ncbi:hypothetical protein Y032_0026g1459 [Ancylostoma ceylanicum]|uniref:Uncharacterized protein n=1 Tax=Ancylostoma ceylanicum TaxID=53326 RepID=A0A016UU14_9BILA|nr:hypothetical protein Y032_0026g1459 [Ancylostoma ceylanicum]